MRNDVGNPIIELPLSSDFVWSGRERTELLASISFRLADKPKITQPKIVYRSDVRANPVHFPSGSEPFP